MSDQIKHQSAFELDANMQTNEQINTELKWLSVMEAPIQVNGFAWWKDERRFRRLPSQLEHRIPPAVHTLANCTAGGQIRFRTNAKKLSIRVQLSETANMDHMPATGQCGFDCYIGAVGCMQYYATTRFNPQSVEYECQLLDIQESKMRDITLHFPLYTGVDDVEIGCNRDAVIEPPLPYRSEKRIIFYGTSITQGGCANRPGMAYPNIISRAIPLEHINLGFSGNGKGEPEMAKLIGQITDPACLVLDYESNCVSTELYKQTLPAFIRIYREAHPNVPILVLSRMAYPRELLQTQVRAERLERLQFQREMVRQQREEGDQHLHFYNGEMLIGTDQEGTVDGIHPTDLGFMRIAEKLTPILEELVSSEL